MERHVRLDVPEDYETSDSTQSSAKKLKLDKSENLTDEALSEDHSSILIVSKTKNSPIVNGLLFWLKLQGHEVHVASLLHETLNLLMDIKFSSAFVDIYQLEKFTSKPFPSKNNKDLLLLGFSSNPDDETTVLPFQEEKVIARAHGVHYYFPDPLEQKDLLSWILFERKLHKYSIDKFVLQLDEDIRMNRFHDRERLVPVEHRHSHELTNEFAHKLIQRHQSNHDVSTPSTPLSLSQPHNTGKPILGSSPRIVKFEQEAAATDGSNVLVVCTDKNSTTPKSLIFWLKLRGQHVFIATTLEKTLELLEKETFSSAFVDVAQLESFGQTIVQNDKSSRILLLGYSSKPEDETTVMPFKSEKEVAKKHGLHYYFPDPMEVNELLEWILTERKSCEDINKLCSQLDEDIRLNKYHNREKIVPVESRHHSELSSGYADKLNNEIISADQTAVPKNSHAAKFREETNAEDGSNVLLVCEHKDAPTASALLFWLKLKGHHVIIATSFRETLRYLEERRIVTVFADVTQLETFPEKVFPFKSHHSALLLGFSSSKDDEAKTLPFKDEKEIASAYRLHYYFPDPLEVSDLLEWILLERRLHSDDIEKFLKQLDDDIRLKKFRDIDKVVPVENRHYHELSGEYAHKLQESSFRDSNRLSESSTMMSGTFLQAVFNFFSGGWSNNSES